MTDWQWDRLIIFFNIKTIWKITQRICEWIECVSRAVRYTAHAAHGIPTASNGFCARMHLCQFDELWMKTLDQPGEACVRLATSRPLSCRLCFEVEKSRVEVARRAAWEDQTPSQALAQLPLSRRQLRPRLREGLVFSGYDTSRERGKCELSTYFTCRNLNWLAILISKRD